ncbi:hypothetical protein RvY_04602 [Ramazzottius varieornatus]|uniref:BZIP domain-containing protein n=1 Tax=Ramazzottius varieornatus TaxID=947166 RepID=A0A1D1V1D2_RAMVA|nr:hypothetical protein RvY_04602 [Ramazzottius varieornatus]
MASAEAHHENHQSTASWSMSSLPAVNTPRDSVNPYFRVPYPPLGPAPAFRTRLDRSISSSSRSISPKEEDGTSNGMMQAPGLGNMRDHPFPPRLPSLFTPCFLPGFFSLDMAGGYSVAYPHMFTPPVLDLVPPPPRMPHVTTISDNTNICDGPSTSRLPHPFPQIRGPPRNFPPRGSRTDEYERSRSDPGGKSDLSRTTFPAVSVIKRAPPLEPVPEQVPRPKSALPRSSPGPLRHVRARSHRTPAPDSEMASKSSHAVYAKLNRERRKKYIAELEQYRAVHKQVQMEKRKVLKNLREEAAALQKEITGYRNELLHNKELMALLRSASASTPASTSTEIL